MISSRWPRPIGIIESIALRPVAIGSLTDLRGMMPGAFTSTRARLAELIGPLPSIGLPSASTTRPSSSLPTGTSTIAPVRLTVWPSLISRSRAENDDADVVGLEVQRHAARAVLELDHLAGLDLVEAVGAGDAVADAQHLADLGDFRLGAEIGDLALQNRRNFSGADVHQPTSFMARRIALSLVRSEPSTMREPSRTMSPPMIDGIDLRVEIDLAAAGAGLELLLERREIVSSESGVAVTTSARVTPRACVVELADSRAIISRSQKSRRFLATRRTKLAASPSIRSRARMASSAFVWSASEKTGLLTRSWRSGLPAISASSLPSASATASVWRSSCASEKRAEA